MAVRAKQQPAEALRVALDAVWERSYPSILERVRRVEDAVTALDGGTSADERLALGRAEAHKLAGLLGTFELHRGSELARSLEQALATTVGGTTRRETAAAAAELRSLVERAAPR
jgi:HPt (histidine-containing phosphotransfer) domain-containing protein